MNDKIMTAPPTQMPLFTFSDSPHFFAPALAPLDESFGWDAAMRTPQSSDDGGVEIPMMREADATPSSRPRSSRKSTSPTSANNEPKPPANDLLFITGTTPADFKTKKNMTRVRKKAMGSWLEKEKKPRDSKKEQRRQSREASTCSRASVGSWEMPDQYSGNDAAPRRLGEKREAPEYSPTESAYEHETTTTPEEVQKVSRIPPVTGEFVLPSAPIVIPSRETLALPYYEYIPGPFQSIGKPLDPFVTIYQVSHPRVSVETLKYHCTQAFGSRAMGRYWVPALVKSPHAFLSTLCIASAHFDAINDRAIESVQTMALRQEIIHLISQSLLNPQTRTNDFNVIAVTQLIASELIAGQETALAYHEAGLETMVYQRGGLNKLGLNGRVASTATWVLLESAVLREARPKAIYTHFATIHSAKNYPNTATIPESPIYCPKGEYETLKRSAGCKSQALDLLKDIRMMLDLFLHETKQSRQNSLSLKNIFKKITTQYPKVAELRKTNVLSPNDWKYEAIRITAIITATAIMHRIPLSEALVHAAALKNGTALDTSQHTVSPTTATTRHDSPTTTFSTSPTYTTAYSPSYDHEQQNNPFAFTPTTPATKLPFPSPPFALHAMTPLPLPNPLHYPTTSTSVSITVSKPTPPSPTAALLTHLRTALQSSDLVECWSDMAGVLLWISLTVGAASRCLSSSPSSRDPREDERNQVLRKWFRAMTMRVSIVLCFEHPQAMLGTLGRMGEVVEAVGYAENASGSAGVGASVSVNGVEKRGEKKREAGPSKRRRA